MTNESDGAQRPNILYIQSDQHNPNITGCYGESTVRTPEPGRARLAGHDLYQRLLRLAHLRAVEDVPPHRTLPIRERGMVQYPDSELGDTDLRPRDGRGRLSTGTDRQAPLRGLRPASRVRRTLRWRPQPELHGQHSPGRPRRLSKGPPVRRASLWRSPATDRAPTRYTTSTSPPRRWTTSTGSASGRSPGSKSSRSPCPLG